RLRGTPPGGEHLRDAVALHALELLELALEPLGDARQREHRGRDDLDGDGGPGRLVLRAVHGPGPAPAEPVTQLEARRQRVRSGRLPFEGDQACSVDW